MAQHSHMSVNWLLHGFILVSFGIHVLIFLHMAGIYENRAMSYIELTLQQVSKPSTRDIPSPRLRRQQVQKTTVTPIYPKPFQVPKMKLDPVVTRTPTVTNDQIPIPQMPDTVSAASVPVTGFSAQPESVADTTDVQTQFTTARDYFEMLNLRIHSVKKYPESARSRHIQGRVKVKFVLLADGSLKEVQVVKTSRHKNLDEAAVTAVKKAAPFPRPPASLFKTPVTFQIHILFELT
ncbi:energy transducer TonB [Desulfotignum balticum]|uniref:energy transducer TonB n=1 Tax=Desulfotignum balticum TaxID=115781 RepID=UPI000421528A|nr:TonB family protein [Desulfotignum balticum]